MQFPNLGGVQSRGHRAAEAFAILPGMGQASPRSLSQNLSFELGEYGQQAGHRSTGRRGQVQCLGQGNEPDSKMFQFLERGQQIRNRPAPAVQPPYEHYIDFSAPGGVQPRRAA